MDYELFKGMVTDKLIGYMPEQYRAGKLEIWEINTINRTQDMVNIFLDGEKASMVSSAIYVDDMYKKYQEYGDIQKVFQESAAYLADALKENPIPANLLDYGQAKDRIVMALVNTQQNRELLDTVPHREFQDLSIVYRWVLAKGEHEMASILVTHPLAEKIGMDEAALYDMAVKNTERILPPMVQTLGGMLQAVYAEIGIEDEVELLGMLMDETPPENDMIVISNHQNLHGAAAMLYKGVLPKLAEQVGGDLYIMPASIHEVIAVPAAGKEPYELARMVNEVNGEQVRLEERLSNQVYHYGKDSRKITMATDTPNKCLDDYAQEKDSMVEGRQR